MKRSTKSKPQHCLPQVLHKTCNLPAYMLHRLLIRWKQQTRATYTIFLQQPFSIRIMHNDCTTTYVRGLYGTHERRTKMEVSMIEVGPPSSKRHFCSFETELSIFCQRRSFASGIPMCSALLTQVWMTMLYAFDAYIICLICLCLQSWSLLNMYAVDSMIFREKNLKTTINWPSYLLCEDATTCRSC